ncbi:hypothetical protein [uncultured Hyphomonas sp.]|uniref:winged helix domain-containing protein n=1 Tax=uncultured Hyphomonas sp. TaxID=225298 RepID=UPI000C3F8BD7|nr:hypothetical protein [Hyphomonadaceae bacterium]MBA28056.1 hypothetical protein [Hyphomonadaceae bacterium]
MARYEIIGANGSHVIEARGRDEWALIELAAAGQAGCTAIENPAPRWSGYVHNLRAMGVDIETVTERHSGLFPGNHARYVLHSLVLFAEAKDAA